MMYGIVHLIYDIFNLWDYDNMSSLYYLEEDEQQDIIDNERFLYEIF